MNEQLPQDAMRWRRSFLINTTVGGVMLAMALVGYCLELLYPQLANSLAVVLLIPAILCLFIASLHYTRYVQRK